MKKIASLLGLLVIVSLSFQAYSMTPDDLKTQFLKACDINKKSGKVVLKGLSADTTMKLADSSFLSSYDTSTSTFKTLQKSFYDYDSGGLLIRVLSIQPDKTGMNWKNQLRIEKNYTGALLTQEISYSWNNDLQVWTPSFRTDYFYDPALMLESYTEQIYEQDSSLIFSARYSYLYAGDDINTITKQSWNNNTQQWVFQQKNTYSYSGTIIDKLITQIWNSSLNAWLDFERSSYTYDLSKLTTILNERYDQNTTEWSLYSKSDYTYNAENGKVETERLSYYNVDKWDNYNEKLFGYENDMIKTIVNKFYYSWLQNWREISKTEYYYSEHEVFGIEESISQLNFVQNPVYRGSQSELKNLEPNITYLFELISMTGVRYRLGNFTARDLFKIPSGIKDGTYILMVSHKGELLGIQKIILLQ